VGLLVVAGVIVLLVAPGSGSSLPLEPTSTLGALAAGPSPGQNGPESVPIPNAKALAPAAALEPGETLDGINCEPIEQLAYHVHAHLTIFVDGAQRLIPYGIGIARPWQGVKTKAGYFVTSGNCFAWLHTHASDGIIHIESPSAKTYTLGDFFDIWHQPLGPTRIGSSTGRVVAFYNGKYYTANPRTIPLRPHAQIQLDLGKPLIAPERITFPNGL
jgi:hypothetical protein